VFRLANWEDDWIVITIVSGWGFGCCHLLLRQVGFGGGIRVKSEYTLDVYYLCLHLGKKWF
jgi:hypothetical protein